MTVPATRPVSSDEGPVLVAWSGGKDSALALHALRAEGVEVAGLLTTVTLGFGRVSMHGVRRELLARQATALGLPLLEVGIRHRASDAEYEEAMAGALRQARGRGVRRVAFGDLFLEDVRRYRERNLVHCGMGGIFPLWGQDTARLARRFLALGFAARVCCLDPRRLPSSFAGRRYDAAFLRQLPTDVDPCGENGEFHTFVSDGPGFASPVGCRVGERVEREGFCFADLLPEEAV